MSVAKTIVRRLGLQDYAEVLRQMQQFTLHRGSELADEIWITEHRPVYTLGLNGKRDHILQQVDIPLVESDRGGQVTYHGPGQLVVYLLADLRRLGLGARQVVSLLEQAMIATLSQYGITAEARADAPGVYVDQRKIGSLGLRIRRGCCYHGLSLNNDLDLAPFQAINPCGHAGLQVTRMADLGIHITTEALAVPVVQQIIKAIEL